MNWQRRAVGGQKVLLHFSQKGASLPAMASAAQEAKLIKQQNQKPVAAVQEDCIQID